MDTVLLFSFKGVLHLLPKISMFCALSQNNQHLLEKWFKELKNGIEILVGQAVFKLQIKTVKMLFGSITQEPLGYLNFDAIFEFLGKFTIRCI